MSEGEQVREQANSAKLLVPTSRYEQSAVNVEQSSSLRNALPNMEGRDEALCNVESNGVVE